MNFYTFYQDVHVMIYVGFGFLMVFIRTGSWQAVCLNFLCAAWVSLVVMLALPFWHMVFTNDFKLIELDFETLINGDFGAGSILISFGVILGKFSPT
jgi:ammonium transporter Rh